MIKLPEGELRDYLPATMKNDVDMICLSYAIRKETEQLVKYRKATMIYHFIDCVPEPILDLLAVELRSLYYSDTLPIKTKRDIVKNTLRWHMQAGTPGAVEEMVKIVFGEGEVVEWPDFDEPPYTPGTFDITTSARLTPDILEYFSSIIDRVKNARSHLRRILIKREWTLQEYSASGVATSPRFPVTNNAAPRSSGALMQEKAVSAVTASPHEGITNNASPRDAGLSMKEHASAVALAVPHESVTNHVSARASLLYASDSAGALAYASPKETVGNTEAAKSSRAKGAAAYFGSSASAAPCMTIENTKAAAQDAAAANAWAAFSAFSTPMVQITNGKQEKAVWLKYGAQGAAAFAAHPKITIGKGGMAGNGRDF